jgi:uncharacterized membrane protein
MAGTLVIWPLLKAVHVLAVLLWVGGMAFAHFFLRPAVAVLEPPQRLKLMHAVLGRFFRAVAWATGAILLTGLAMLHGPGRAVGAPSVLQSWPWTWWLMTAVGLLMMGIFGHIRLLRWPVMDRAVRAGDMPAAAAALVGIRTWVAVNLVLGVGVVLVVLLG